MDERIRIEATPSGYAIVGEIREGGEFAAVGERLPIPDEWEVGIHAVIFASAHGCRIGGDADGAAGPVALKAAAEIRAIRAVLRRDADSLAEAASGLALLRVRFGEDTPGYASLVHDFASAAEESMDSAERLAEALQSSADGADGERANAIFGRIMAEPSLAAIFAGLRAYWAEA